MTFSQVGFFFFYGAFIYTNDSKYMLLVVIWALIMVFEAITSAWLAKREMARLEKKMNAHLEQLKDHLCNLEEQSKKESSKSTTNDDSKNT